jgi:hypothetical protein
MIDRVTGNKALPESIRQDITTLGQSARFDQLDDARNRGLGIVSLDEIEVALGFRFAKRSF